MKLFVGLVLLVAALVMFTGCSDSGNITQPEQNSLDGSSLVRPEFIDTRPAEVIERYVQNASDAYLSERVKPENPGGGNGGGGGGGGGSEEDPNPNPAHKYAYIIGISDYEGTANDLQYCDDDAQDWRTYLMGEGFTVQMDVDQNATAANIEDGLQWLANSAVPGDEIAFIYSGHGVSYGQSGSCLISTDMYYLTHDYAMEFVSAANCSKKMIAIDACEIGDFHDNSEPGMYIATASDRSYSYDGEAWMENGVWTYYYIEILEQGEVFNENAAEYAKNEMKIWGRTYHVRVTPKNTDAYEGFFDL